MFFISINISRAKLNCSLLPDAARSKRCVKSVANTGSGIGDLLAWYTKQQAAVHKRYANLEGSGVYHEQTALALADAADMTLLDRQPIVDSIDFLEKQLAKREQDIDDRINKHPGLKEGYDLFTSIPAVGPQAGKLLPEVTSFNAEPSCHRPNVGVQWIVDAAGPVQAGTSMVQRLIFTGEATNTAGELLTFPCNSLEAIP